MKTLVLSAIAAVLLAASPALAERHHGNGPSPGGGGHPMRASHGMGHPMSHGMGHRAPSAHFHHILVRQHARTIHRAHRGAVSALRTHRTTVAVHSGHHATVRTAARLRHLHRNFHSPRRFHFGVYHRPHGWYAHRWVFGERLPRAWFVHDYWIGDWAIFGLIEPPYGLVWVRVGDDALLIDPDTGEIYEVAYDVFW